MLYSRKKSPSSLLPSVSGGGGGGGDGGGGGGVCVCVWWWWWWWWWWGGGGGGGGHEASGYQSIKTIVFPGVVDVVASNKAIAQKPWHVLGATQGQVEPNGHYAEQAIIGQNDTITCVTLSTFKP